MADGTAPPRIIDRPAQPYAAITRAVTMSTIGEIADRFPDLFGWLGAHGIELAGAPFLKYDRFDADGTLLMQAGAPVSDVRGGDDLVSFGVLPAGRFATVSHLGHPSELHEVTRELLEWAADQGIQWDAVESSGREQWGCRMEVYYTDPQEQPDMNLWETDLVFRLAD